MNALRSVFARPLRMPPGRAITLAMRNGCKNAGIPHYSPHSLRHRYASVKLAEGVPVTELAAHLGHARKVHDLGRVLARLAQ